MIGINYRKQNFAQTIHDHTGGRGVDVILDVVVAPYWKHTLAAVPWQDRIVTVGTLSG